MKTTKISGVEFAVRRSRGKCGREELTAQIENIGPVTLSFSETRHLQTEEPLGWYWNSARDTSRRALGSEQYGLYFSTPEAALADFVATGGAR